MPQREIPLRWACAEAAPALLDSRAAMTVVVKLGSSIVADPGGDVRGDVLDGVCEQVAALHAGGEEVVMVTSGAIALGMRLMGFEARPRAIDELQAASAVGQGTLFRAYEQRLARHEVHAAQVLLNSSDVSTRVNYLNARATLRRLVSWHAVPVINENDTTATDEITFGDNDFLAAQVALLLGARLLVLLTDTAGLHTADPRRDPDARLIEQVDDFGTLEGLEIGDRTSPFGSGGMRSKVAAARMATAAGIEVVVCDGTQPSTLADAAAGERCRPRARGDDGTRRHGRGGLSHCVGSRSIGAQCCRRRPDHPRAAERRGQFRDSDHPRPHAGHRCAVQTWGLQCTVPGACADRSGHRIDGTPGRGDLLRARGSAAGSGAPDQHAGSSGAQGDP